MSQVHAAFLTLYNHASNLLLELKRGELRIEGALKVKLDAFESAVAHSKLVIPLVNNPAPVQESASGPFDGGPVSAGAAAPKPAEPSAEDIDRQLFQQGADMARRDEPLPEEASGALKRGYWSVKPQIGDPGEKPATPPPAPAAPESAPAS
jgi:hypothetical protein